MLSSIAYGTPLSGNGSPTQPAQPSSGLLTWIGPGYYTLTIPDVMGTKAGTYLVTNPAFIQGYDENAKLLGY